MKIRIAFLLFFILLSKTYSQDIFPETEIIFQTRGASSNQMTTFEVRPIVFTTICESEPLELNTITYRRLTNYNCAVSKQDVYATVSLIGNIYCRNSGLEYIFYNESWQGSQTCDGKSEYRPFANALYEIKIKLNGVEKFKFTLDTRHNSLPNGCDNSCLGNDISIIYFVNNNTVGGASGFWVNGDYDPIEYNKYYPWWKLRKYNCTLALSYFNEKFLPILHQPIIQNYHPYLQWTKPGTQNDFLFYDLQRSINFGPFYSILQTSNINTVSYLDGGVYWVPNQNAVNVRYRIAAVYDFYSADISNYQELTTVDIMLWKSREGINNKDYYLSQNYPNPFNPSTNIYYKTKEAGKVKILVYDILGREVKQLVNEYEEPGEYLINFDGSDLNSGIYIYTIKVNNYTETKKMHLIK